MLSENYISEIEKVLKVCVDLSDFTKRLKICTEDFAYIYDELVLHDSNISTQSISNLKELNNKKIIEPNYRYMVGLQYKDLKSLGLIEVEEDVLLSRVKGLKSFSDYDVSDFEICERAKDCGINVVPSETIIKEIMIIYIKSLDIVSSSRYDIVTTLRKFDLFKDLKDVDVISLAKEAGIDIV